MRRPLLATILILTFLASSVAAFGPGGLFAGGYLLALLGAISLWRRGERQEAWILAALLIGAPALIALARQFDSQVRESGRHPTCGNNLKAIAIALYTYQERYGSFPPACICDESGKPMHSWRVLLLPFMERDDVYRKYDFAEPWNGPHNRLLESEMPEWYTCPIAEKLGANRPPLTSYVAVTGPDTAWPGCKSRRLKEFTAGTDRTILLVEVAHSDIHWMEPRDPRLEDLLASRSGACEPLTSHHVAESYWLAPEPGSGNVARPDVAVHFLPGRIDKADAEAFLTINRGGPTDVQDFTEHMPLVGRPRWDHVIGLPVFCLSLVALFVLALTMRRPGKQTAPDALTRPGDEPLPPPSCP